MSRPRRREIRFKNERMLEPPMPEVPLRRLAKQDQKWPAEIPASMRFVHRVVSKWPCDDESRRFAATGPLQMFEYNFPVISPIKYEDFGTDDSVLSPGSSVDENSNSPVTPSTSLLPDHSEFATSAPQYSGFSISSAANTRWLPVTVVPGKEPMPTTVAPTDVFGSHDQLSGADGHYANSLSPEPPSSVCLDDVYFDDDASMYADSRRTSISVDNGFDCQHPLASSVATAYSCASAPQAFESSFSSHGNDHISPPGNRFLQASSVRHGQPYQHSTQCLDSYGHNDFEGSSFQYSPYVADIPSFSAIHESPYIGHSRGTSALPSHGSNMYTSSQLQAGMPQYSTQPGPSRDFSIAPELLHGPPTRSVPPPIADHPHFHDHPYQPQQYTPYDVLVYPPEPVNRNTYTTSQPAYMETHSYGPIQGAVTWTQQPGPVHRLPQENQPSLPIRRQSGPSSGSHPIQNSPVSVQDPQPLRQSPQLQAESILSQPLLSPQVPKARSPVAKVQTLGSSCKNTVSIDPSCVLPAISPYDVNRAASWTAHFEALGRKGKKKKKVYRRKGAVPSPKPEPSTTTLHQCPLCTRQFERRNGLAIHLKWHYKPQLPLPPIQGLGILVPEQLSSKSPAPPNSPEHVDIEGSLGDGATADDGPAQPRTNVLSIDSLLNVPATPSEHAASGTPFSTPPSSPGGSRKASVDDTEDAAPRSENAGSIWDLFGTEG